MLPANLEAYSNESRRHFNGYHVRFTDIARGGLRVVLPATAEAYTVESGRHFMECFNLAWAQQLKNKDIPEGGSKAVCLVTPTPGLERDQLMHGCVKVRLRVGARFRVRAKVRLGVGAGFRVRASPNPSPNLTLTRPSPTACST